MHFNQLLIFQRQNLVVKNSESGDNIERVLVRRRTDDNITICSPTHSEM